MNNVFGWGLPPGVSQNDIDEYYDESDYDTKTCPNCNAFALNQECVGEVQEEMSECRGVLHGDGVTPCGEAHAHEPHQYVSWYSRDVKWRCDQCQYTVTTRK